MAKREPPMSAAPAYIVYGHRHAVRLVTRLVAIGLLRRRDPHGLRRHRLAARLRELAVGLRRHARRRGERRRRQARAQRHRGCREARRHQVAAARASRKKHKPAKPIPPNSQIPIMVLNSNGIHGAAHRLARPGAGLRLPDHLRRQRAEARPAHDRAVRQGLRAGRAQARAAGRQRAVRDAARRHHARAGRHAPSSSSSSAPDAFRSRGAGVARRDHVRVGAGEDRVVAEPASARARLARQPPSFQQ